MPATMDRHERAIRAAQAAALSILPGLGHLYIGERKSFKLLPASLLLLVVARYWWMSALLPLAGLAIWSARDCARIVMRGRGGVTPPAPASASSKS